MYLYTTTVKGVGQMSVHNCVLEEVQRQLQIHLAQEPGALICPCLQCQNDVVALAATRLPARYTASTQGRLLAGFELQSKQIQLDIFKAIIQAIKQVNNAPRHDPGRLVMP